MAALWLPWTSLGAAVTWARSIPRRLMAGQRILIPLTKVRILPRELRRGARVGAGRRPRWRHHLDGVRPMTLLAPGALPAALVVRATSTCRPVPIAVGDTEHASRTRSPGSRLFLKQEVDNIFGYVKCRAVWVNGAAAIDLLDSADHKVLTGVPGSERLPADPPFAPAKKPASSPRRRRPRDCSPARKLEAEADERRRAALTVPTATVAGCWTPRESATPSTTERLDLRVDL